MDASIAAFDAALSEGDGEIRRPDALAEIGRKSVGTSSTTRSATNKKEEQDMYQKTKLTLALAALLLMTGIAPVIAQETEDEPPPPQTLITNVDVFDGFSDRLQKGMNVLVEGNMIKAVSSGSTGARADATRDRWQRQGDDPGAHRHAPARDAESSRGHSVLSDTLGRCCRRRLRPFTTWNNNMLLKGITTDPRHCR